MSRALLAVVLVTSGCAANVKYVPRWPLTAPATRFVSVQVENARPPDQGGDNPRAVGIARGGYGNPMTFEQDNPGDMLRVVREATVDALHGAGVEDKADATPRLRARVMQFWMDGYVGYAAWVEVELWLIDAAGRTLWTQKVEGREGGAVFSFGAASDLLSTALTHLASAAQAQFREAAFQSAVSVPMAP